jgi:hypothetical protein
VDFYVVYIKEIHPEDGWQVKHNETEGVVLRQHQSIEERVTVGQTCMLRLDLQLPGLVDEMDDGVTRAYNAVPERLYLIGSDGTVAYKGGMGPIDFKPKQWREAISDYLGAHSD